MKHGDPGPVMVVDGEVFPGDMTAFLEQERAESEYLFWEKAAGCWWCKLCGRELANYKGHAPECPMHRIPADLHALKA